MYDNIDELKVNSLVEFVGILSTDPTLVDFETGHNELGEDDPFSSELLPERLSHHPPPSLVPRLHCLYATPLHHFNPLLSGSLPSTVTQEVLTEQGCNVKLCRDTLIDILTVMCQGDVLAAEYILLHLLSSV
jgi:hypothetical protein